MKPIVQEVQVCIATGQTLPISQFYSHEITRKDGTTYTWIDKKCKAYRIQQMKKRRICKKAEQAFNAIQSERNALENRAEDVKHQNKTKTFFQKARDLLRKIF